MTQPETPTPNTTIPFVPLHVHSQFSLLEAASKNKELIACAKANGFPAIALTDSGNLYGAVDFYNQCKYAGIKAIIGCEIAVIEGAITEKSRTPTQNLVLLCKNLTGYQNLVKLVSMAHLEGFYYRPRINWELLKQHAEGLIVLTDCIHGPIGYNVLRGNMQAARDRINWLKTVFADDLYIELQDHGTGPEMQVTAEAIKIAKELGLDCVITNDSRFTYAGQETAVDILLCMQAGTTVKDLNRRKTYGANYFVKTAEQHLENFHHLDPKIVRQAIDNTLIVAEKCQFNWPMGKSILPEYPLPEGKTEAQYLEDIVFEYAKKRYGDPLPPVVIDRANFELNVINEMGFPAYFLIVWDFIDYARKQGIPVGPGRGSAAGSLVAYVLGITNLDPIEHNLLFERFLNPERVSMPDIDIDFCIERRGEVIDYVTQRYGRERVCQIATFGTLAAKAAIKAVARVTEIPFEESNRISKLIPSTPGTKLKDALAEGMELKAEYDANANVKEWVDLALQLEGIACNVGTHAAGVVISKDALTDVIAVQQSKDGQLISQFTMLDLDKLGLLKMDFLGLRNLTIIHNTLGHIAKRNGVVPDLDTLTLDDDPPVYELLQAGDTDGVFQLESSGMKQLVKDLKPSTFEDINALVALYRPGPLNSGMVKTFVDRKHGRQAVSFPHPSLEPILKDTYGTIVYQEQIMQIAQVLSGFSLGQADLLRRAMGKKDAAVMAKEREGFVAGATKNGVDEKLSNELFDIMSEFAAYCFNRSHSAAYAFVAFQTAYLKAHHPVEYLSALLSSVSDSLDKIQHYIATGKRMGIEVLPPDVSQSIVDFSPVGEAIRFGLASVKGVGVGAVESIIKAREESPFASLEDFFKRVDNKVLNRKTLEALIGAGAFSSFGYSRKHLQENLDTLIQYANQCASQAETGQSSLFDLLGADDAGAGSGLLLQGNPTEEFLPEGIQKLEKELIGFYLTSHPLDDLVDTLPMVTTHALSELKALKDGVEVRVGGLVASSGQRMSKKNKPLIIGSLEDFTGANDFLVFGDAVQKYKDLLVAGNKIVMNAKVSFRGDEEDSFTLIVNDVSSIATVEPLVLRFEVPPNFQEVAFIGKVLAGNKGDLPVILQFANGVRLKTSPAYWIDASRIDQVKTALKYTLKEACLV